MHLLAHFCTNTLMLVSVKTIDGDVFQVYSCLHSSNIPKKKGIILCNHVVLFFFFRVLSSNSTIENFHLWPHVSTLLQRRLHFHDKEGWTELSKKGFLGVIITGEGWKGGRRKMRRMSDCWLVLFNWFLFVPHLSFRCTLTFLEADLQIFIISRDLLDHPQWVFPLKLVL